MIRISCPTDVDAAERPRLPSPHAVASLHRVPGLPQRSPVGRRGFVTAPATVADPRPAPSETAGAMASATAADDHPDVELIGVTKRFGSVVAVDRMNLAIPAGSFTSLLGPSGCGKTTTLRMIAGFEQPNEGEILIGGLDVAGTPPYKRDVNTVFQQYALFPHMSILDNVSYGLKQRKVGKRERYQRAGEALELVQLTGRDKHRPAMLSGGQQQRVALARALV